MRKITFLSVSIFIVYLTYQFGINSTTQPTSIESTNVETPIISQIEEQTEDVKNIVKEKKPLPEPKRQAPVDQHSNAVAAQEIEENLIQKKKLLWKKKNFDPNHPGLVKELAPGTELPDGTIVGQEEALLFLDVFEKDLADRLSELTAQELKEKFAKELHWFQRVGNFRKRQKCEALQKMQDSFGLNKTVRSTCVANIMKTEEETWGL